MKRIFLAIAYIFTIYTVSYSQTECTGPLTVTITGSDSGEALSASVDETVQPLCNADLGSISITISGGSPDYSIQWTKDGDNFSTSEDLSDLEDGAYAATITDDNGCTFEIEAIDITSPELLDAEYTAVDPECNIAEQDGNGSISLVVSGGTGEYSYAWSTENGSEVDATAQNQSGLSGGTYSVVVTDENDCTWTADITLTDPALFEITDVASENPSCNPENGSGDGSIDLTVEGGTGNYSYAWELDGEAISGGASLTDLGPGVYTVTVTDENDCSINTEVTLEAPEAIMASASADSPILCNGGTTSATVSASGGSGTYTYSLDGAEAQSSSTFDDLTAGEYTITVYDENGCSTTAELSITEPEALTAGSCTVAQDMCQVGEGEIEIQVNGGVAPYTVSWSSSNDGSLNEETGTITEDGGSTTFTGAEGGKSYTFSITDANGCEL